MIGEDIIGFVAAGLTTISFVPQVVKIVKTRHTADISLLMYLIFALGVALWAVYGVMLGRAPVIVANLITFALVSIVLFYKIRDLRRARRTLSLPS
jgi:MtN3 and saliva related transmembrane protein